MVILGKKQVATQDTVEFQDTVVTVDLELVDTLAIRDIQAVALVVIQVIQVTLAVEYQGILDLG